MHEDMVKDMYCISVYSEEIQALDSSADVPLCSLLLFLCHVCNMLSCVCVFAMLLANMEYRWALHL